ncbi:MAG: S9 family peptidase [Gemmataceae bacterium]|nr:S9 family peptidase [Gemmataceae bacterium]
MRPAFTLAVLLAASGPAAAQPRPVAPADYASVATVTEVAVSPDGKQVAYTLATWGAEADNRRTDLWVVATDGTGKPRQLTADRANDRHPKWSADGKSVYVLANRTKDGQKRPPYNGTSQVWRVAADGEAAPAAVTKVAGGVVHFDCAPGSGEVFYAVDAEVIDDDPFRPLRAKYDALTYGHGRRKVSEVYRLPAGGAAGVVVPAERYVRDFAASRDGKRLALITAPDDTVIRSEGDSRVDVWEADTSKVTPTDQGWRKGAGSPWPWLESVAWNPAGTRLAYCAIWDGYPAEVIVCERTDGWPARRMPRPEGVHVRGYGSPLWFGEVAGLNILAERSGSVFPLAFDRYGNVYLPPSGGASVVYAADRSGGRSVIVGGKDGALPELLAVSDQDPPTRLTDLNPQAKEWALPSVEHVTWAAPDGSTVGGALELPPGYKKGDKPLPLVVAIHGGPTTASHAALEFDPHNGRLYLAAAGYAVLCPNYRGSTGYGDKFVTDLLGRENDLDVKDILAGIQHLIKEGIADPDRIGVMGWSNGGYLTNCLISMKDGPVKFKAASSGAGIVDTVAEWGFNDEPAYPRVLKTGLPWEKPEVYRKTSPTYQLGNVKTPTLIHVGENDERCPPGHSRMLYRALKENVKVPTQLVVYPGEPHGLGKLSHRTAKMEWDLAWFDKYLKGR